MEVEEVNKIKIRRAQRRVDEIKKFYRHLRIYLVVNILLLMVKYQLLDFLTENGVQDPGFLDWFQLNFLSTPMIWGIGLFLHGLYVFKFGARPFNELKPRFLRDWEERQIRKYVEEEHKNIDKFK